MVESFAASDEDHDETLLQRGGGDVRGEASGTMVVRLSGAGFPLRDANLVDDRGEHRVRQVGGGLRQFVERLLEETDLSIEHTDHAADRRVDETGEAKGDDHLHHRCTLSRRGGEVGAVQGGDVAGFPMAESTSSSLGREGEGLLC